MTDFSARAPYQPEKPYELHDQTKIVPPGPPTRDFVSRHLSIIVGGVATLVFIALAFQARAGWENHREWVVAVTVPGLALGGLGVGNLIARGKPMLLGPGMLVLGVCVVFTILNIQRGYATEGQDNWRDVMSILQGITLTIALHLFFGAFVWNEWKNPIKAPQPEM